MKDVTLDSFVMAMIKDTCTLPYLYDFAVQGCIDIFRINLNCSSTDDEIKVRFKKCWNNLFGTGGSHYAKEYR